MSEALEQRLIQLERQVKSQARAIRLLSCALVALVALTALGAAALEGKEVDTVTAKRLHIKDADGRVRIKLEAPNAGRTGDAKIVVLAEDGKEVAGLGQYSKAVAVVWARRYTGDSPSAYLATSAQCSWVSARSGNGITPIEFISSKSGHLIRLFDPQRAKAGVELVMAGKVPALKISDKTGAVKILGSIDARGEPMLQVEKSGFARHPGIAVPQVLLMRDEPVFQFELKK
jgi:hypothetical protein